LSYLARNEYTGNGSTTDFTVSFSYLTSTHVKVYLDGALKTLTTDYTWVNSTTIRMNSAPASSSSLSIRRDTSSAARLVDYVSGSSLNEDDLDEDSLQAFYLAQEAIDGGTSAAVSAAASATAAAASAASIAVRPPQGRLSITSGTPVSTVNSLVDVPTLYWCLYGGSTYPWYDGTNWTVREISELSITLDGYAAAHTGYHVGGYVFDVFLYNDGGTDRLVTGPMWSGTAYGPDQVRSAAISRLNGIWVNSASMTARFGNAAGNTVTVPAQRGTYVGTAMSYDTGTPGAQSELGGLLSLQFGAPNEHAWIPFWNCYNRVPYVCTMADPTNSWTYSTGAWRKLNNNDNNKAFSVTGIAEDPVSAKLQYAQLGQVGVAAFSNFLSLGLNSETSPYAGAVPGYSLSQDTYRIYGPVHSFAEFPPLAGWNTIVALEYGHTAGGTTTYGDDNDPGFENGALVVRGMY
jgi:hypothetical protein